MATTGTATSIGIGDDATASYSGRGPTAVDNVVKPDLVALERLRRVVCAARAP